MSIDRRRFAMGAAWLGLGALASGCAGTGGLARAATAPTGTTARRPGQSDVIVLGAGVSGLQAAWMLEQQGLKVTVIEGRNRVGGRVLTLMDQPGFPEMGFNSMGDGYGRGLDAAGRAGVEMWEVGARWRSGPPPLLYIGDKAMTREEWARFPGNPFPDALKATMPGELVGRVFAEHSQLDDWGAWTDPAKAALDIPVYDFLKAQGLSDAAIQLANDHSPYYGRTAWDVSALMMQFNDGFVKSQMAAGTNSWAVKGGNELLPRGMAKLLKGDLLLGREVVAITTTANDATVHCRDGSQFTAGRIVCTLPFSTLRNVDIVPALTGRQAQAVAQLGYQAISMIFVTASSPYWEEDGLAPGMWSDGPLGTVMPQKFGDDPDQITGFIVQARGNLANYWDRMGHDAAKAMVVARIEQLRPAAKGKLTAHCYFSWAEQRFNQGDVSYFEPGQVRDFVNEMARPAGRLHFAGEHTATGARGLEGALESAERVSFEVLEA